MVTVWGNCFQSVKLSCGVGAVGAVGAVVVTISQGVRKTVLRIGRLVKFEITPPSWKDGIFAG